MMYRVGKQFPNKVIAHTKLQCSGGGGGENMMFRVGKQFPNKVIAHTKLLCSSEGGEGENMMYILSGKAAP